MLFVVRFKSFCYIHKKLITQFLSYFIGDHFQHYEFITLTMAFTVVWGLV